MSQVSEAARALVARTKLATLATISDDGSPLATLVATADDGTGRPLCVVSGLSEHTRNLRARPRASVLFVDEVRGEGGLMDRLRVTLTGEFQFLTDDEATSAKEVFLTHHPDAARYVALPDFTAARLEIETVRYVGGFARAATLRLADYLSEGTADR